MIDTHTHTHTFTLGLSHTHIHTSTHIYLPTLPHEQIVTQGQFLEQFNRFEFRIFSPALVDI